MERAGEQSRCSAECSRRCALGSVITSELKAVYRFVHTSLALCTFMVASRVAAQQTTAQPSREQLLRAATRCLHRATGAGPTRRIRLSRRHIRRTRSPASGSELRRSSWATSARRRQICSRASGWASQRRRRAIALANSGQSRAERLRCDCRADPVRGRGDVPSRIGASVGPSSDIAQSECAVVLSARRVRCGGAALPPR